MTRLQELVKEAEAHGWAPAEQKGSHRYFRDARHGTGIRIGVAWHAGSGDCKPGVVKSFRSRIQAADFARQCSVVGERIQWSDALAAAKSKEGKLRDMQDRNFFAAVTCLKCGASSQDKPFVRNGRKNGKTQYMRLCLACSRAALEKARATRHTSIPLAEGENGADMLVRVPAPAPADTVYYNPDLDADTTPTPHYLPIRSAAPEHFPTPVTSSHPDAISLGAWLEDWPAPSVFLVGYLTGQHCYVRVSANSVAILALGGATTGESNLVSPQILRLLAADRMGVVYF